MYDPNEAMKSYATLLKEKGVSAAVSSTLLVISMYIFDALTSKQGIPIVQTIGTFFVSCAYFTWKPKITRFLRGILRGNEFRDKKD